MPQRDLQQIEELQFLFTEQTFTAKSATDGRTRERREFFIPKSKRVAGLSGSEFEIQLRNRLTQRAIARECAEWIRRKARFKSNASSAPMQQFLAVDGAPASVAYMPLSGFTAVDLGYAQGNAVSNFVNRFDEPGEIDILIATDCISEGQNLQDCDFLVNYDIHWNPVRIIQRFGRIDRIGSPNAQIQLANYWPDITLDDYIKLKERVENRMIIADVTATGDDNVLTAKASDTAYRREQLRRLQEEVIELEDVRTGISITDLGLNDFRMDLLNYVKEHGDLASTPKGLHAVVPAEPCKGLEPGIIFALKAVGGDASANRQNRLHPYYLIYMGNDGSVVADQTQVKRLLDLVRTAAKGVTAPVPTAFRPFNARTADGQDMSEPSQLLNAAIRAMIDAKEERDLDSLFSAGATTALSHTIRGLEDFELIAFVVVEQAEAGAAS